MDLESTLDTIETIASYIPEDLDAALDTVVSDLDTAISTVTSYLPDRAAIEGAVDQVVSLIPAELDFMTMMQFLLFFAASSLLLGVLGRVVLGKRSSLNHSLSSVMGILFIYAVTIVVYTFKHWNLTQFLSPLPFVTFSGDYLIVFPIQGAELTAVCYEVLSMVILAFLVNLLDSFVPQGKSVVGWYLLRFVSVILSMLLHLVVNWAVNTYLPDVLVTYAPVILLGILIGMLLLGVLNLLLGLVLTVVNPIIGGIYAFFFSNIIGKQLTKAVFTTVVLCILVYLLGHFGYTIISISVASLTAYIPLAIVCLILWYLIGHHL